MNTLHNLKMKNKNLTTAYIKHFSIHNNQVRSHWYSKKMHFHVDRWEIELTDLC